MKGFAFYIEYPEGVNPNKFTRKNLGTHSGTVIAVSTDRKDLRAEQTGGKFKWITDGFGAFQDYPNCPVCYTSVALSYVRERTKRISEAMAREIHPSLFSYLDN